VNEERPEPDVMDGYERIHRWSGRHPEIDEVEEVAEEVLNL
jgi:hypothetical protein